MQPLLSRSVIGLLALVSLLSLHGCGQPEEPTTPQTGSAEGFWVGSTNTNRTLTGVVLDDGTYYLFYSVAANPAQIAGVIQGTGTSDNGTFTSSNTRDFRIGASTQSATLSATYTNRQSFNGTVTYTGGATVTFTSSFNMAYNSNPTLAAVSGFYTGQAGSSGGVQTANINVTADGPFAGAETNGCAFNGTATPRIRGNAFNQTVVFGALPCFFTGSTLQGIVLFDPASLRLMTAAPDGTRTDAAIFSGLRVF